MTVSARAQSGALAQDLYARVERLYEKSGYSARYGLDVWLTATIIAGFVCSTVYFYGISHLAPIKANWIKHRCNPAYIPLAGWVNPPAGEGAFEYTGRNFEYCTQNVLTNISGHFLSPFYYLLAALRSVVHEAQTAVDSVRSEFAKTRGSVANIANEIVARILNVVTASTVFVVGANSALAKTSGVLVTGLYTLMTAYMSLNSVFQIIIDAVIVGLILLAAIIVPLWMIPFVGPPLAIADTVVFVAILVVFLLFKAFLADVMGIASGNAPPVPACFAGSTPVVLATGDTVPIERLTIGDVLCDGATVTGRMRMSSRDQEVFSIDGVYVTGRHRVFSAGSGLILASAHPRAVRVEDFREQYVYCVNTSSKRLIVGGELYVDWDDLDPMDMCELDVRCSASGLISGPLRAEDVHHHLECGIAGGSMVELDDGRSVDIREVDVNDVLRFGETVLGVVELDGQHVVDVQARVIDADRRLTCTGNVLILDHEMGAVNSHRVSGPDVSDAAALYHLVTDSGSFVVDGVRVGDYNVGLEQHLRPSAFLSR
jgi:hypothetical protein